MSEVAAATDTAPQTKPLRNRIQREHAGYWAGGEQPSVCDARFTADGSRRANGRRNVVRAWARQGRVHPELSRIDRRAEEAKLAYLAHDFGYSTGTIVLRSVVPASVRVPSPAALTVSMPSHNKR